MSKKKEDLEAIADLLYEWAAEHGEPFAAASVVTNSEGTILCADTSTKRPDYKDVSVYKKYETPAAGTARESV